MTVNFVWPCSKLKPPNLTVDNLRVWHCLPISDSKYAQLAALCGHCPWQDGPGKEEPLRGKYFRGLSLIFITLTIILACNVDIFAHQLERWDQGTGRDNIELTTECEATWMVGQSICLSFYTETDTNTNTGLTALTTTLVVSIREKKMLHCRLENAWNRDCLQIPAGFTFPHLRSILSI